MRHLTLVKVLTMVNTIASCEARWRVLEGVLGEKNGEKNRAPKGAASYFLLCLATYVTS